MKGVRPVWLVVRRWVKLVLKRLGALACPEVLLPEAVINVSLLEPAHPETPIETSVPLDPETEEPEYEFDKILDSQIIDKKRKYLVKWSGYDDSANTWEPAKNLPKDAVDEYHEQHPKPIKKPTQPGNPISAPVVEREQRAKPQNEFIHRLTRRGQDRLEQGKLKTTPCRIQMDKCWTHAQDECPFAYSID